MIDNRPTHEFQTTASDWFGGCTAMIMNEDGELEACGWSRDTDIHKTTKRQTVKVRVDMTIEVDVEDYRLNYGVEAIADIKNEVKYAALSACSPEGGMLADGIVSTKLNNI